MARGKKGAASVARSYLGKNPHVRRNTLKRGRGSDAERRLAPVNPGYDRAESSSIGAR